MNKVILIGRLTKDPELRYTASNIAYCQFTVAVDRRYKSENGQQTADFIGVAAWRQTAEFVSKYFSKGNKIGITGSIQTRTWDDKEGQKHYITEVVADEVEFVESKKKETSEYQGVADPDTGKQSNADNFYVLDEDDGDIPF